MLTKEDLQSIGKLIDQKIEPLTLDVQGVKRVVEKVEQKLDQSLEDHAKFFQETWKKLDEVKNDLEKRVEKLEAHTGLTKN